MHTLPRTVQCPDFPLESPERADPNTEGFVARAASFAQTLPADIRAAVGEFRSRSHASGALLLQGMPIGRLPMTPPEPTGPTSKDQVSERTLLSVATLLGEPVGYLPELGGRLVQNIVPTRGASDRQVSTSSAVRLMFHTETAFHPYRPRFLLLLCLRGDPTAATTLSSIHEVIGDLSAETVEVLFQPRFRMGVDESFLSGRQNLLGAPLPVLSGDRAAPTMVFDEDLMIGTDAAATASLAALGDAVSRRHASLTLQAGDLVIIDNARAVHGRSPYTPRFDGLDRWLQRTFVVEQLPSHSRDREGRIIRTEFGRAPVPAAGLI